MQRTPQFITGEFTPHHCFLPDDEYGRCLDTVVKACSDVLVTDASGSKVFLGQRKVEPQPDWWYIGGRSKPGETPEAAAARNVRRELKLDLPLERFEVVANYSFVWQFRQQPPAGNGTADISTVHRLALGDAELAGAVFDEKEYAATKWWPVEDVLSGDFHPALKQAIRDVRAADAFKRLRELVVAGGADADVATAARLLVESSGARDATVDALGGADGAPVAVSFANGRYTYRRAA